MPKTISLFQPLMYEHKSTALTIAEIELENQSLALLHFDTNRNSMSLRLVCERLVLLMMCYNKLLVMQAIRLGIARPMCDGCPLASSPAGRGLFFLCGFLFVGFYMLPFVFVDATPV